MNSFFYLEPVCCSMSSSNCCFLTCIQISQEAGQVVWYSQLFQNFPQCIVIHTVKGFGMVNKAEVGIFMEFSCFSYDPTDVSNLISGSSAFSKTSWTSGRSQFTYCWSLAWRILSITLRATKICLVKAIVFPAVMYGCESWTIKKAEGRRIDAFELWCWRRLLRVPWTARQSNQSILNEISPEYSLEGLMLKLKL